MDEWDEDTEPVETLGEDHPLKAMPHDPNDTDPVMDARRAKVFGALFGEPKLQRFGRYIVLDVLGEGGMGVVLKAYDDKLERQVAIKVLHSDPSGHHGPRLEREAQALAKLGHPNVVQVYEVGEVQGQLFVTMELVKGQTLKKWMDQEPRPDWRACVEMFIALGAGLAAAHERGLVHRDFKPGNAIIDRKGRPRVLDFGLARRTEDEDLEMSGLPSLIERVRSNQIEAEPLAMSLTATGTVLGTPAYMPPEQMTGRGADARSDQFSFCVALYEALYGERPFGGQTLGALTAAVLMGEVRPAPRNNKVPTTLRRVLLRGLAVEPEQRWPSMEALLVELRGLVTPRRQPWATSILALGVAGALIAVVLGQRRGPEHSLCGNAQAELEGIWDEERRSQLRDALSNAARVHAANGRQRLDLQIDAYALNWIEQYDAVCESSYSTETIALPMTCMTLVRGKLDRAIEELLIHHSDADDAQETVDDLPEISQCHDVAILREKFSMSKADSIPPITEVKEVAEGEAHTCALLRDGSVLCWGSVEEVLDQHLDLPPPFIYPTRSRR